jgi:hypothetical protein
LTELSIIHIIIFFLCINSHMPGQIINQFTQAKDKTIPLIILLSYTLVNPVDVHFHKRNCTMHVKR